VQDRQLTRGLTREMSGRAAARGFNASEYVSRPAPQLAAHFRIALAGPAIFSMRFAFRRPHFPVIIVVGDYVFGATSPAGLKKCLRRALRPGIEVKLLDQTWEWFELAPDSDLLIPSFLNRTTPSKRAVVALVNGRANRPPEAPLCEPRSLSSHTREDIFAELLALLRTS